MTKKKAISILKVMIKKFVCISPFLMNIAVLEPAYPAK